MITLSLKAILRYSVSQNLSLRTAPDIFGSVLAPPIVGSILTILLAAQNGPKITTIVDHHIALVGAFPSNEHDASFKSSRS